MASIIGGGPRKLPRIMRKSVVRKPVRKEIQDDEGAKIKRQGFEVHSGVLTVNYNLPGMFKPKQLPGTANEVESYPCRFCGEDKIFLTSIGLEKHGKESHPQNMNEILSDINTIAGEWRKREFEKSRSRDQQAMDRMRIEARAHQAMKLALGRNSPSIGADQYESCTICNMLVNIAHPTAMESHQRAHKKNDELRLQLIDQFGVEAVQRLTCESCSLVFPHGDKLAAHVASHHTRRKKYICKFCGHISQSMSELNLHKNDIHNITSWTNLPEYLKARRVYLMDEDKKAARRRANNDLNSDGTVRQPVIGVVSEGDTAGRVTCPECGLKLERPRLLFKHMDRVHSKTSFCCMVETGGLPNFEIEVSNGSVFWTCCETKFNNRPEFIEHRRLHIPAPVEEVIIENNVESHDMPSTSQPMMQEDNTEVEEAQEYGQDLPYEGMQIVLPDGYDFNEPLFYLNSSGRKIQLVPVQHPDGTIDPLHLVPQYIDGDQEEDGGHILVEDEDMIALREVEGGVVEDNGYDHYQMNMGNDWSNMQMILVNEDEVLAEEQVDDMGDHHMDHQLIENVDESDEGVVEINGQPLFD